LAALAVGRAATLSCDLSEYKEAPGLRAEIAGDALRVSWLGERGQRLQASFAIDGARPVVRDWR
jgi:hypothetical protein